MMKNKLKSKRLDKTVAANRRKRMLSNNKKKSFGATVLSCR
ncbi:hypothetical protein QWY96_02825 [Vibrio artabrorum]|uniref:30S ribosomal protein S20 n=1 Tax=Vibrio artabrorum TaxID=446374 RepID=A0ABT8CFG1_9VIBR|nr:hypothetical protein [Vibrio artabrorum]MDN3700099.1 hypothetical protein [Vibrio artabrorum]